MKKSFKEIVGEVCSQTSNFELSRKRQGFGIQYLDAAEEFLYKLSNADRKKIEAKVKDASERRDPKLLKKLTRNIWEFRINSEGIQYRLLAFWSSDETPRVMLVTHGFVKKSNKVPSHQIQRSEQVRLLYLNQKKSYDHQQ